MRPIVVRYAHNYRPATAAEHRPAPAANHPASANSWHICPRCGLEVYKSSWGTHERRCLLVESVFGSAAQLIETFRANPALTPAALARRVAGVGRGFIVEVLVAGGVSYAEIAARRVSPPSRPPVACCRRCEVLLDARGARPSSGDPALCGWCAAELAVEAALKERGS